MPNDDIRCICDLTDIFDRETRIPRAVEGCPAHWVRYAFQQYLIERFGEPPYEDEPER